MSESAPVEVRFPLLPEVLAGETADVYFWRARHVLAAMGRDPMVGMDVFPGRSGLVCGINQVIQLLQAVGFSGQLWGRHEADPMLAGESVLQLVAPYSAIGVYETAILGILASSSGWCTAAREVVDAAGLIPVVSFGARHLHPNVASLMDYAAVLAGCVGCSTPLGAALTGTKASGSMPHAFVLIMGDTVAAAEAFHRTVDDDVPRIVLVDTFQDEALESVRVADALGEAIEGIRLDTPRERGGVTPGLVKEVRARLDLAGHARVQILVSGGITPERIRQFSESDAPVSSYGVGSYISGARPIDFTADIREIDSLPVAKRGRIPGLQSRERLRRLL